MTVDKDVGGSNRRRNRIVGGAVILCMIVIVLVATLVPILRKKDDHDHTRKHQKPNTQTPSSRINVNSSVLQGACLGDVCSWQSVRYASPPVGKLRFAAPIDPPELSAGTIDLTQPGAMCLQGGGGNQSEDCLFANIYRPENVSSNARYPVLLYFHGGGFGSGAGSLYDLTNMVSTSIDMGTPIVAMTINYRLGAFGFLAGDEFTKQSDVTLNNGLRDMRQAIQWAAKNIAIWNGDPEKITIWGQSAGAFGVGAQTLDYSTRPLYVGAIMQSGAPGGVPIDPASSRQGVFNGVMDRAGCLGTTSAFDCLRNVSASKLRNVSNEFGDLSSDVAGVLRGRGTWLPVFDGGNTTNGFYSARPSQLISQRRIVNVPMLIGNCLDEGTIFVPGVINTPRAAQDWLWRLYFNPPLPAANVTLAESLAAEMDENNVFAAYPYNLPDGSPFGTGMQAFHGVDWKQMTAIYGDIRFVSNVRFLQQQLSNRQDVYGYQFAQNLKYPAYQGVPHGSDVDVVQMNGKRYARSGLGKVMAQQWIAFTVGQSPNARGLPQWPKYDVNATNQLMQYSSGNTALIADNFRAQEIALLNGQEILDATSR